MTGQIEVAGRGYVMWVVADHPSDFPQHVVARKWRYDTDPPMATGDIILARSVEELREQLITAGYARLHRAPEDNPVILETWI